MSDTYFTRTAIGNQFARHRVATEKSNLFENLGEDRKASLLSCMCQPVSELPVFGYWDSADEWMAVTTSALEWAVNGESHIMRLIDLKLVDADRQEHLRKQAATGMSVSDIKLSFHRLTIEDHAGNRQEMHVEPGRPFYGVWGALRTLTVWANSERRETGARS